MALRGKKPTEVQKRLKCLFFGPAGVGKTTAAIQFPKPYLIDGEKGAEEKEYVKMLNKGGGRYWFNNDPDELLTEVTSLLSEKHEFQTLIIDPLTTFYNELLDKGAKELGTDFGRHKGPANRYMKHLLNLLARLDMNVIITSHAKANWARTKDSAGKDTVVQEGITFDCYDKLDYLFDLVFEVRKRGKDMPREGIVRKTRIGAFADGDVFPFCYDEIASRYGRAFIERDATPVALASKEQIDTLEELLGVRSDGPTLLEKWLDKSQAETLAEMPADTAQKCIEFLTSKASAKKETGNASAT